MKYYDPNKGTVKNLINNIIDNKLKLFESNIEESYNKIINNIANVLKVKKEVIEEKNQLWIENQLIEKVKNISERLQMIQTQSVMSTTIGQKLASQAEVNERKNVRQVAEIRSLEQNYSETMADRDGLKEQISELKSQIVQLKNEIKLQADKEQTLMQVSDHYK